MSEPLTVAVAQSVCVPGDVGANAAAHAAGIGGPDYEATAGHSCIWAADGAVLARAGATPGVVVSAALY